MIQACTRASRSSSATPRRAAHAPGFGAIVLETWRTLIKDLTTTYRPELHYMRGPGPKWREKHAVLARPEMPLSAAALPRSHRRASRAYAPVAVPG